MQLKFLNGLSSIGLFFAHVWFVLRGGFLFFVGFLPTFFYCLFSNRIFIISRVFCKVKLLLS